MPGGHCQGMGVEGLLRPTHFLPDSMKRSYSTAILQDRAWRLWAAEQLVLTTLPVGGEGCEWAWGSTLAGEPWSLPQPSPHPSAPPLPIQPGFSQYPPPAAACLAQRDPGG